jgi:hypothetical protein
VLATSDGQLLLIFYLPHMEYEGSIGFVPRKMKNFYCWFSRFRTFYGQKTWFERKKKFRMSRAGAVAVAVAVAAAAAVAVERKICATPTA